MEREKAELEVTLPDGEVAKVVAREEDRWIVEREDGSRISILPPGHTVVSEKAEATVPRELGS